MDDASNKRDPEVVRKYTELIKEQLLLKEEHKSNMKELADKIGELEV